MLRLFLIFVIIDNHNNRFSVEAFPRSLKKMPNGHLEDDDDQEYEKCYYQLKTTVSKTSSNLEKVSNRVFYGHCMSMNGPDGCCLEGHYKPGLCPNLGHICCTKPDHDCDEMNNNKALTKKNLEHRKNWLKLTNGGGGGGQLNGQRSLPTPSDHHDLLPIEVIDKKFRPIRRFRTNFEIIEMPAHMQLDAIKFVTDALDRYRYDFDDAAEYLCQLLDQKYPEPSPSSSSSPNSATVHDGHGSWWSCFIGKEYGYLVEPLKGRYMSFYIDHDIHVMAFVSKFKHGSK